MEATERFAELFTRPAAEIPLDEAALLIAAHAYPSLDVAAQLDRIDELAGRVFAPTLDAVVRTLFVDLGFDGNQGDYHDPRNSFLNDVLDHRRGIPISLSVLTMAVGSRVGVPLAGVAMPGHFLVRDQVDPSEFVDPFHGGARLDPAGCVAAFRRVHGAGAPFDPRYLTPVEPPAILARMLANLRAVYGSRGPRQDLLWVLRLRSLVPGVPAEERAELASVLTATGDFRQAAAELDALADLLGGALGGEYRRSAEQLRARLN